MGQPISHPQVLAFVASLAKKLTLLASLALCVGLGGVVEGNAATGAERVNINTATTSEIEKLPFVGQAKAKAIVRYREQHGFFETLDELRAVPDLGESTFQAIKPYLVLGDGPVPDGGEGRRRIVTQPGEVRLLRDQEYFPVLRQMIDQAERSIDLAMFLFKVTKSSKNRAAALVEDLIRAGKRGVMVSVLLEKSDYDPQLNRENQLVAAQLKRQGVSVRFDSEKVTTHVKAVVIDRRYSLVGSHNFTASALAYNHEATLLVDNQALAAQLVGYMRDIR